MGPDGLYDFQSFSFGTNGQSLLVPTRDNEYSLYLRPVVEFLFGANSTPEAQPVVASLDSQSYAAQLSILNLQPYLSSSTQSYLSLPSGVSYPECVDSMHLIDPCLTSNVVSTSSSPCRVLLLSMVI